MRMRLGIVLGLVCSMGFAGGTFAQEQTGTPVAVDLTNKSPQIAALTGRFHILDTRSAPVEIAPPGTVEDDSEISDNRTATDVPRRLRSSYRSGAF
jgi:hypothetical protein